MNLKLQIRSLNIELGREKGSQNSRSTLRAKVAEPVPDGFHLSDANLRSGARERISPSLFPRAVPGVGVGPIEPVSVIPTFDHRPLINQRAERPAMQRAKGRAATMWNWAGKCELALPCNSHRWPRISSKPILPRGDSGSIASRLLTLL
jgi:hypothetical protein